MISATYERNDTLFSTLCNFPHYRLENTINRLPNSLFLGGTDALDDYLWSYVHDTLLRVETPNRESPMPNFEDHLVHKKEQALAAAHEVEVLERLQQRFSLEFDDKAGLGQVLFSADVNSMVDSVRYEYCHDMQSREVTFAHPYVEIEGKKVYAKPHTYTLVDIEYETGEKDTPPEITWIDKMVKAGIPESIIEQVKKRIDEAPDEYDQTMDEIRRIRRLDEDDADWWKDT